MPFEFLSFNNILGFLKKIKYKKVIDMYFGMYGKGISPHLKESLEVGFKEIKEQIEKLKEDQITFF